MPITKADMLLEEEAECITIMEVCNKHLSARWRMVTPICGTSDSRLAVMKHYQDGWWMRTVYHCHSALSLDTMPRKHCLDCINHTAASSRPELDNLRIP